MRRVYRSRRGRGRVSPLLLGGTPPSGGAPPPEPGDVLLIEGTTDAILLEGTPDKLLLEA